MGLRIQNSNEIIVKVGADELSFRVKEFTPGKFFDYFKNMKLGESQMLSSMRFALDMVEEVEGIDRPDEKKAGEWISLTTKQKDWKDYMLSTHTNVVAALAKYYSDKLKPAIAGDAKDFFPLSGRDSQTLSQTAKDARKKTRNIKNGRAKNAAKKPGKTAQAK